jgi:hypothetical protein
VQPIVGGATVNPGRRFAIKQIEEYDDQFAKKMRLFPDDEPLDLLYIFAPRGNAVGDHIKLSWKLFPYMFLCRMAITGPFETKSLASVLLSNFLSMLGKPLYAREGCIAPPDKAAW